jgi:hypothetical protein
MTAGSYEMKGLALIFGMILIGLLTAQYASSQKTGDITARVVFAVR